MYEFLKGKASFKENVPIPYLGIVRSQNIIFGLCMVRKGLDSKLGSLASESTNLPTDPQLMPSFYFSPPMRIGLFH